MAPLAFDPERLTAVVFDFDGTLADSRIDFPAMRRRTRELVERFAALPTGPERMALELVEEAARSLPDERASALRAAADALLKSIERESLEAAAPFPGVAPTLAALERSGRALGIITRNSREAVRAFLRRHPLSHDVLFAREDVPRVKPDPLHLETALAALGREPGATLMVGDHPTDVECGRRAGAWTCGVLAGEGSRSAFEAAGAHLVVESVAAVGSLFELGRPA